MHWKGAATKLDAKPFAFRLPFSLIESSTNEFSSCIGHGGSCEVYKANIFDVPVAVKALTAMGGLPEEQKRREELQFVAEMELLMKVCHPNICRLLGVSADGPQRCLVLEMCSGGSLYDVLKEDRQKRAEGVTPLFGWQKRLQACVATARGAGSSALARPAHGSPGREDPKCASHEDDRGRHDSSYEGCRLRHGAQRCALEARFCSSYRDGEREIPRHDEEHHQDKAVHVSQSVSQSVNHACYECRIQMIIVLVS